MIKETNLHKINILKKNNQESNAITRECIETALIKLMNTKHFQKISITDIAKYAGVSRTAYYRNYNSKDDIISQYIKNLNRNFSTVLKQYDPIIETKESWIALFNALIPIFSQFKLLLESGFCEKIMLEFAKAMNQRVETKDHALYYSNIYWAGAISFMISEWVRNNMDISPEEIAEIGSNLMVNGISTIKIYGNKC